MGCVFTYPSSYNCIQIQNDDDTAAKATHCNKRQTHIHTLLQYLGRPWVALGELGGGDVEDQVAQQPVVQLGLPLAFCLIVGFWWVERCVWVWGVGVWERALLSTHIPPHPKTKHTYNITNLVSPGPESASFCSQRGVRAGPRSAGRDSSQTSCGFGSLVWGGRGMWWVGSSNQ